MLFRSIAERSNAGTFRVANRSAASVRPHAASSGTDSGDRIAVRSAIQAQATSTVVRVANPRILTSRPANAVEPPDSPSTQVAPRDSIASLIRRAENSCRPEPLHAPRRVGCIPTERDVQRGPSGDAQWRRVTNQARDLKETMDNDKPAAAENIELADRILDQLDTIIRECEAETRPLEVDPARNQLFELFVTAEAAGCVGDDADPDLSADGICHALATRWGLKAAAQQSFESQTSIPPEHIGKMRSLWSVMRMWMEWTYAWERWPEFHDGETGR